MRSKEFMLEAGISPEMYKSLVGGYETRVRTLPKFDTNTAFIK